MSDIAIKVDNVSKMYRIFDKPEDRLKDGILWRWGKRYGREFWALKDISFEVKKGESVGIIGRNGSGKSTLLQIIAGTLQPTGGNVQVNGRVAALLELGSGFNPDYTGRENVYMNAAILGLTKEEIDNKFDEIAGFADIGDFINQPLMTYSSGMVMRLAFAVQIAIKPDILIVDEALSVGDEAFQRKCFSRMDNLKANGMTLLFVSHSAGQVIELCRSAILLNHGAKLLEGRPKSVVTIYQKWIHSNKATASDMLEEFNLLEHSLNTDKDRPLSSTQKNKSNFTTDSPTKEQNDDDASFLAPEMAPHSTVEYSTKGAKIIAPHIETLSGKHVNHLLRRKEYIFSYKVEFSRSMQGVRFGCMFKTIQGLELGGILSHSTLNNDLNIDANKVLSVRFSFTCRLLPGVYFMNAGVVAKTATGEEFMHRLIDGVIFRVIEESGLTLTGLCDFATQQPVSISSLNESEDKRQFDRNTDNQSA